MYLPKNEAPRSAKLSEPLEARLGDSLNRAQRLPTLRVEVLN